MAFVSRCKPKISYECMSLFWRSFSTSPRVTSRVPRLTDLPRGRGGRSSFSGNVTTVFGCSGFVGPLVVNRLGQIGSQVIVAHRGEMYDVEPMKVAGDIGQIVFMDYHLRDDDSIMQALQYSNSVVCLVGRDFNTKNFSMWEANAEGPARIARLAQRAGVERLIHFSHLNASPAPQPIYMKGGSQFLKAKWEGEQMVRDAFPSATIFRPADIYGEHDKFLQYYAMKKRHTYGRMLLKGGETAPALPLWNQGRLTIKQPVYVGDVATGVIRALADPTTAGKIIDIVGPHRYYLYDLVTYFGQILRWNEVRIPEISLLFKLRVALCEYLTTYRPKMSFERLETEFITDRVGSGDMKLADLLGGVDQLTDLEKRAQFHLRFNRRYQTYDHDVGEYADPDPLLKAHEVETELTLSQLR